MIIVDLEPKNRVAIIDSQQFQLCFDDDADTGPVAPNSAWNERDPSTNNAIA